MELNRRDLIKGVVAGSAVAAMGVAGTAMAAESAKKDAAASSKASDAVAWDAEYDVVVLGLGGAGANAAVAAFEEGAKTLVCEKAPEGQEPCNTKASGQFVIATDDADQLYGYFSKLMGKFNNWDEDALRGMCEGAAGNWDWMVNTLGGDPELICPEVSPADQPDKFPMEKNQKDAWVLTEKPWGLDRDGYVYHWNEFPEIPESQHCLCLTASGTRFDASYYNLCMSAVNARVDGDRLTVWKGCPGKRLVTDGDGAVIGVVVEKDGKELKVKANGGVCLCTGGFEANPDMISGFTQLPYTYLQAGTTNTGDGIRMAQQVGAELWHMSNVSGYMWTYQHPGLTTTRFGGASAKNGIYAGLNGARFQNEQTATRHGRINIGGRWISTPMPLPAYLILDSAHIADGPLTSGFSDDNSAEIESGEIISGDTIEELSANIRAIGDAPDFNANGELDAALEKYNRHCHANDGQGEEDDWGRMCTVPVETGPFYALKIGPTLFNTQGGPRRNQFAQVIDTEGMPIEGLFEGGEMGSVFADMYNGGGNLSETMVFGRYAGQNAAKRAKGEFKGATEKAVMHSEKLAAAAAAQAKSEQVDVASVPDGTYEGHGQGFGGEMVLSVTVAGGKITACEVVSDAETPTIGELALPTYCEDIVAKQDPEAIDVASGASNTLRGFKAAIEDALKSATK